MHIGWLTLGDGQPLDPVSNAADEIINNVRTTTYARNMGIGWLHDCHDCDSAGEYALSGTLYDTPQTDPAPWYNPAFPDTAGFCGIFGIDVTGAEDFTSTSTVTNSLRFGGVIGSRYAGPRTLVIRALAVGDSDCAVREGFNWYRKHLFSRQKPCGDEKLTYFYCCPPMECRPDDTRDPCPCEDMTTPGGPCWVNTYAELAAGPTECTPDWWPNTYAELRDGPPDGTDWCHWVYQYYEITLGADKWSCGSEECVVPYIWQFYDCAVIEGPTVLERRNMPSAGAYLEFEMTLVAADPYPHRLRGHTVWKIDPT